MALKNIFCITTLMLLSNSSLFGMWWGYRALEYEEEYAATHLRTWAETFDYYSPTESAESKLRKEKEELFKELVASTQNDNNFYFSLLPIEILKKAVECYIGEK